MFPVDPCRGSDGTCMQKWLLIPSLLVLQQRSTSVLSELLRHTPCKVKPTPKRSNLRIELCLWIYTIYPLLQYTRTALALLERASDQHSEDPGSNPGWISLSFFTTNSCSYHTVGCFTCMPINDFFQ